MMNCSERTWLNEDGLEISCIEWTPDVVEFDGVVLTHYVQQVSATPSCPKILIHSAALRKNLSAPKKAPETQLDASRCARDLGLLVKQAREKYRGLPVFLEGVSESALISTSALVEKIGKVDFLVLDRPIFPSESDSWMETGLSSILPVWNYLFSQETDF
ncbi:Oidioi.mRNA.OKI2018_I69.chr2.g6828.t1.cds [Oikopleura dioica]|uniref:Oidioi.mRNA.OKI2018_I69.chr2.g6828.t1.cds n=1 Tax=Oikopleura dioica TaxID=34765 RepID=A0ABN7T4P3_OIKDI|nr:Oidioi.mRNA.OKI2018_I69.chr2.g6828.t1.cds [Oikopleura dioica]